MLYKSVTHVRAFRGQIVCRAQLLIAGAYFAADCRRTRSRLSRGDCFAGCRCALRHDASVLFDTLRIIGITAPLSALLVCRVSFIEHYAMFVVFSALKPGDAGRRLREVMSIAKHCHARRLQFRGFARTRQRYQLMVVSSFSADIGASFGALRAAMLFCRAGSGRAVAEFHR